MLCTQRTVIVLSHVGLAHNIVKNKVNGFTVELGNIEVLINVMYVCENKRTHKKHRYKSIEVYKY